MACIAADYEDDYEEDGCYECGGEGFVSDCVEEWACVDPEYGCNYCTRQCPLCNPAQRSPELDAVLSEALAAQGTSARDGQDPQDLEAKPAGPVPQGCAHNPTGAA